MQIAHLCWQPEDQIPGTHGPMCTFTGDAIWAAGMFPFTPIIKWIEIPDFFKCGKKKGNAVSYRVMGGSGYGRKLSEKE